MTRKTDGNNEEVEKSLPLTDKQDALNSKETQQMLSESSEQKIKDLEMIVKRLQADFENYKKYVEKEKTELAIRYSANMVKKLLPALDDFEIALEHAKKTKKEDLQKGMEMIYNNFIKTLKSEGLEEVTALNAKFDPFLHEAILHEESDTEEGKITKVIKKGYTFKSHILRHALVAVSRGNKKNAQKTEEGEKK